MKIDLSYETEYSNSVIPTTLIPPLVHKRFDFRLVGLLIHTQLTKKKSQAAEPQAESLPPRSAPVNRRLNYRHYKTVGSFVGFAIFHSL